ncbi:UNVERIFIED_CONTAM: protein IQ-DOMAIN 31 [Sesamum radiatum]|uniref:Protein IQ-DOMAIN 31 n=1 Tax=Sesamum radiatum TaxID=300843 RepID=A0AAW2P4N2_SESRA
MDSTLALNDELSYKEEQSGKENNKVRKRRSLPAKQEYPENISQNSPSVPSYMAATESAKAKLRAQGSSKFGEDGAEHGYTRRHSLPASTNSKLNSQSPRVQKPVQANGKGGSKTNRSVTSSKDAWVEEMRVGNCAKLGRLGGLLAAEYRVNAEHGT